MLELASDGLSLHQMGGATLSADICERELRAWRAEEFWHWLMRLHTYTHFPEHLIRVYDIPLSPKISKREKECSGSLFIMVTEISF